jgi:hypothetical protein
MQESEALECSPANKVRRPSPGIPDDQVLNLSEFAKPTGISPFKAARRNAWTKYQLETCHEQRQEPKATRRMVSSRQR